MNITNCRFRLILFFFSLAFGVSAEPLVKDVLLDEGRLVIKGEGFGEKKNPHPVLWAFGSRVIENGIDTTKEMGVVPGKPVPVGSDGEAFVWSRGEGVVFSEKSRIPEVSHTYRSENDGWLGWPHAFGGDDTPYADKAYFSWRVQSDGDIANYKTIAVTSIKGVFLDGGDPFSPGESIRVMPIDRGETIGRVVYYDAEKSWIHIEVSGLTSDHFAGAVISGVDSGATALVDSTVFYRSGSSSKYFRSYETVADAGTHVVATTNRLITAQLDENGKELSRAFESEGDSGYGLPNVSYSSQWQLIEVYIDLSGDYGAGYFKLNGKDSKSFSGLYIKDSKPKDAGPTISNIGWEAAGGVDMVNVALNFGEIYFDTSPQRVLFANTPSVVEAGSNVEFQYLVSWSDKEIVVDKGYGALNLSSPIYVFVYDEYDSVSNGFCILNCSGGEYPPSRIGLDVE
ncbi:hypothetical protein [Marinobacter sp. EVN1]|uniref:hypothetical protein n=1 Tax=Marinobacter sp. EVN1 TaxID=1397532 RepID=UPI0004B0F295|nr:hypothetical protein [Marinobacter sp. EVN1]